MKTKTTCICLEGCKHRLKHSPYCEIPEMRDAWVIFKLTNGKSSPTDVSGLDGSICGYYEKEM